MIYEVEQAQKDIRIALDQDIVSKQLIDTDDIDTLALDDLIASKIADAARIVEMAAPTYMIDCGHNFGDAIYWRDMFSGWTLLPDDFMRLVVFKMDDWERPLYSAISESDDEYDQQFSRFRGIRGTPQKPICAIVSRPEGMVLEFWSCKSEDATVERAVYLPMPEIDCNGGIEICQKCYRSVVYYAAALVAQALGGTDAGSGLIEISKTLMNKG